MKSKYTAAILAFFLGGIGVHKFYLGQNVMGIIYLIFCWTTVPMWIAFIECLIFLFMDTNEFNKKYNKEQVNQQYDYTAPRNDYKASNRCPNCGSEVALNCRFCTSCGHKLN